MKSIEPWQEEFISKNMLSMTPTEIVAKTGVSRFTVYERLKELKKELEKRMVRQQRTSGEYSNSKYIQKYFEQ